MGERRLEHWTHDDLFLGYLPAKSVMTPDEAVATATTIGRFFEYLEVTGRMSKKSDRVADLVDHIDDHMDEYLELMADPESGGPSKRILMAMLADGVDIGDQDQTLAWIETFNAGPLGDREDILRPFVPLAIPNQVSTSLGISYPRWARP